MSVHSLKWSIGNDPLSGGFARTPADLFWAGRDIYDAQLRNKDDANSDDAKYSDYDQPDLVESI
jgi:hypothetical protein